MHTVNWQQYNIKTYLELSDDGDPSSGDEGERELEVEENSLHVQSSIM